MTSESQVSAAYLSKQSSGNADVISKLGYLWPVFRRSHGQESLISIVVDQDAFVASALSIVCLLNEIAACRQTDLALVKAL